MTDRTLLRSGLALLAITLLILNAGLLVGQSFFWGLPSLQFVPWRLEVLNQIAQGVIPLWNPLSGAGAPLAANYQTAVFYPLTYLTLLLTPWTMSLLAVAHLWLGGWGMARLTERLGAPALGQILGAFAFGLTSYLVARLGTYPTITTAAWAPWLIWAALGIIEDRRRAAAWTALFTALLLLAGHAQTAYFTLVLAGVFTVYVLTQRRRWAVSRLVRLAAALALGTAAAAIQLVPTAELLLTSQRGDGVDYDFAMNFSYAPARILNLFAPNIFGSPADGSYYTEGAYFEDAVYVGMLPLIAAVVAVINRLRSRGRAGGSMGQTTLFWLVIFIIGLVMALGRYSPVFPFLYQYVPTFDLFQAPVRWHFWTVFSLSVLAAFGTAYWQDSWKSARLMRWTRRLTFAGIAGAIVCLIFSVTQGGNVAILARAVAVASFVAATGGLLTLTMPRGSAPSWRWSLLVIAILGVDLTVANWGLNPTVTSDFYARQPDAMTNERIFLREAEQDRLRFEQFLRFDDYRIATEAREAYRETRLPNMNLLDDVPSLNNFDPLLVGHHAEFMTWVESASEPVRENLLAAAGVGGAARAWIAASVCFLTDEEAGSERMLDETADLRARPVAVGDGTCDPAQPPPGRVLSLTDESTAVIITAQLDAPGWLVLADTDYPGWTAWWEDRELPIVRVNHTFRAVALEAGEQIVRFEYRPVWLPWAAGVSVGGWLIILVIFRVRLRSSA